MKLTPKQKAFCDEYIISLNATQSAIKAGYSKKTAKEIGFENLTKPNIKEYIESRLSQKDVDRVANQDEVLELLSSIARGIEQEEEVGFTYDGRAIKINKKASIKDRIKALELLGKRYVLFTDKIQADISQVVSFVGEEDLED